ncbi:hypothetical protein Nocox_13000 [Nonomuraea coxensis DSM 45129]|uniref:Core-binding (CB) domain-containing protein n=1 Tax=Nonomuraea coxensis DSM 45129 TaxID=1122611 RepID=A0ABX8TXW2_9ACTN|nr:hypothetical protein Nocox_13000 [Nonomuraea coxensis DSM 45129]
MCLRCSHNAHLNRNQLCRLCLVTIRTADKTWLADPRPHRSTPLFLLLPQVRLPNARPLDRTPAAPRTLPPRNPAWVCAELAALPRDDPAICPPLPSGQQLLLTSQRTLTLRLAARIADRVPAGYPRAAEAAYAYVARADTILPSLTADAEAVLADIRREAAKLGWNTWTVAQVLRTLRILLGWIGAQAPIPEEDIRSLPGLVNHTSATRVVFLLERRGLVIPADDRSTIAEQRWVTSRIHRLPASFAEELDRWVTAMRGHGRRRRHPRSWEVIGNYLRAVQPILLQWSTQHTSLREITPEHIKAALDKLTGTPAQGARTGLRSIFSTLKQERVIFRDPTRAIVLPAIPTLPLPLPDDQVGGLINRVHAPIERLIVALVAIHALHTKDLPAILLRDVDTANATLSVRRGKRRRHTVHLDAFTQTLLTAWLQDRQRRWPTSTNPHLLITAAAAYRHDDASISMGSVISIFRRAGISARRIRADRLLYEAKVTTDPLHLMRVLGVSAGTAMRYVHAAHAEPASVPPVR